MTGPGSTLAVLAGDRLRQVLAAVAAITVVSGATQVVAPGLVLDLVGGATTTTAEHLFAIIGMFMVVVGGLLLQGLLRPPMPDYVALWCAVQKLGAAIAVGVGVARDVMGPLALLVAAFDLLSAVLIALLWQRLRTPAPAALAA